MKQSIDESMNRRIEKSNSRIIAVAAGLYAVLLVLAWIGGGLWKDCASEKLLRSARDEFATRINGQIATMQWFQTALVFDAFGSATNAARCAEEIAAFEGDVAKQRRRHAQAPARSVAEMRALADRLYIDELNIVSSNGIVIASNVPKVVGDDWHNDPNTAEFLKLLSPTSSVGRMAQPRMSQPFRHGTVNPEYYCAYFAVAFDDRSGIVEVGFSIERLVAVLAYADLAAIRQWDFGRDGHFTAIDEDGDRAPDPIPHGADESRWERGVLDRIDEDGEPAYRLTFAFAGRLFAALVPDSEFGEERMVAFLVFALTSALLILIFAAILVRLAHARRRVEALRQEADERQTQDLAVARKIQMSSLPRAETFEPEILSFEVTAEMRPAREVGGDYYDFFRVSERMVAFVIGDVSGKGVPAALFMHEAKNAFHEALRREGTLPEAVRAMNAALCAQNEAEMFVTAWFGLLDVTTGDLEYVNAGHNRPYVLTADGAVERLDARGGRFIGMFPDANYRSSRLALRLGDRFVLYTDGVTEAMNHERRPYGDKRLVALLNTAPLNLVKAITEDVAAYVAGEDPSDDLTLLVVAWNGLPKTEERIFVVTAPLVADSSGAFGGGYETTGEALAFVREQTGSLDGKRRARLLNAVDEWIANVVTHSGASQLRVSVAHVPGRCRIILADDGVAYDPLQHRDPDTHLAIEERPIGGLGILMMKKLVDVVTHRRAAEWNILSLVSLLPRC